MLSYLPFLSQSIPLIWSRVIDWLINQSDQATFTEYLPWMGHSQGMAKMWVSWSLHTLKNHYPLDKETETPSEVKWLTPRVLGLSVGARSRTISFNFLIWVLPLQPAAHFAVFGGEKNLTLGYFLVYFLSLSCASLAGPFVSPNCDTNVCIQRAQTCSLWPGACKLWLFSLVQQYFKTHTLEAIRAA